MMNRRFLRCLCCVFALLAATAATAEDAATPVYKEIRRYDAPEAVQAVAVDAEHFYAIGDDVIGKYSKSTGQLEKRWKSTPEVPLSHMDSGVVIDGKLYCANSNYPHYPEASSMEVWEVDTLEHVDSHSLGVFDGSMTWVDRHDGSWWVVFAHYSRMREADPLHKDTRWTSLVRFDDQWRRMGGWVFPREVLERFEPDSCSGGTWGTDGLLYCSGHDRGEVYQLALPKAGSTLRLLKTIPAPITGQGIALDRDEPDVLYGIDRPKRQVVVAKLSETP
jgi:hypothetical protein